MKQIMWQKYEDMLEEQISAPFFKESILNSLYPEEELEDSDHKYDDKLDPNHSHNERDMIEKGFKLSFSESLAPEILLTSIFDCWVGHTNFNITKDFVNKLDKSEGVEALKICSRYRFFVGIGRMFDFKNVRKNIEKTLQEERD